MTKGKSKQRLLHDGVKAIDKSIGAQLQTKPTNARAARTRDPKQTKPSGSRSEKAWAVETAQTGTSTEQAPFSGPPAKGETTLPSPRQAWQLVPSRVTKKHANQSKPDQILSASSSPSACGSSTRNNSPSSRTTLNTNASDFDEDGHLTGNAYQNRKQRGVCLYCSDFGHWAARCPNDKKLARFGRK